MAKFCGKCGTKLNEQTGLCPNCDTSKNGSKIDSSKDKSCKKDYSNKKGVKKAFVIKALSLFLVVALIFSAVSGVLVYYRFANLPFVSSILNGLGIGHNVPETNTSEFTYHITKQEHIKFDSETGNRYVDNELLLTTNSNTSNDELSQTLKEVGGVIVGKIDELNYYQVQLDNNYDYSELQNLIKKLSQNNTISTAGLNYAFSVDANSYIPNDKNWKKSWSDVPEGINWGIEAIEAPAAWSYTDSMQNVNIGVMDTMFYTEHEDLIFSEKPFGNNLAIEKYEEFNSHGSHVSGIIGATFNNNVGVSGVSPKSNLYGASLWGIMDGYNLTTIHTYRVALYYLIAVNKCKVINISMSDRLLEFCASQEIDSTTKPATAAIETLSRDISDFLTLLLNDGNEFVICVCAGNQNDGTYNYFKKDDNDNQIPYAYYSYSDYENYLNGDESTYDYSLYKDRANEIKNRLVKAENIESNNIFASIADTKIRERIIVVGAVQNEYDEANKTHSGYSIASFSQCGGEVDILAPGVDIYSTVVEKGWFNRLKSAYENSSGTSQATPFVTGVAGLVFSINPKLSGAQVKEVLCNNTTGEYGIEKYGLLNAKQVVEEVLNKDSSQSSAQKEEINRANESDIALFQTMLNKTESVWWNSNGMIDSVDSSLVFDVNSSTASFVIDQYISVLAPDFGVYAYLYGNESVSTVKNDPNNRFENGAFVLEADKVDWIIKNMFGVQPNRKANDSTAFYYKDDKLYIEQFLGRGSGSWIEYTITDYYELENQKYGLVVRADLCVEPNKSELSENYYFVAMLRNDREHGNYWAIEKFSKQKTCFDISQKDTTQSNIDVYDLGTLTVSGTLATKTYEINSNNKGIVYILKPDSPLNINYYANSTSSPTKYSLSEIQCNFKYEDQANYNVGKKITVTGKAMEAHTGHHLTDIVLTECTLDTSDNTKDNSEAKGMSVDEAKKIAEKYWKFTDGKTDSGITVSIGCNENETITFGGVKYYLFRYRALIDEGDYAHWTTWDQVYINAVTGECSYDPPK